MLIVEDLHVSYDRVTAVRGVSFRVAPGEIVCLVGPNGAGKSTTLLAITGVVLPAAGQIRYEGAGLIGRSMEDTARLGISLVPEGRHIFGTLTVEENLRIGAVSRRDRNEIATDLERVFQQFPVLEERLKTSAGKLSGGEQQQLAIARALMARPKLLLVDEPALGLAPQIVDRVYDILIKLRSDGMSLLVVEQSTERAMTIADRIYVMRNGELKFNGEANPSVNRSSIEEAYFGFSTEA